MFPRQSCRLGSLSYTHELIELASGGESGEILFVSHFMYEEPIRAQKGFSKLDFSRRISLAGRAELPQKQDPRTGTSIAARSKCFVVHRAVRQFDVNTYECI